MNYVKQRHGVTIGQQTAERLKFEIGSAWPLDDDLTAEVKGRDLVSGLPKTVMLTSEEMRHALQEPMRAIIGDDQGDARAHTARTGRGHRAARHHARRWRVPAARDSRTGCGPRRR